MNDQAMKALAKHDAMRPRLLDWDLNAAAVVPANLVVSDNPAIKLEAWKRTGRAHDRGKFFLPAGGTARRPDPGQ